LFAKLNKLEWKYGTCEGMVDIQIAAAEIRRGKKRKKIDGKKPQDENIMVCPIP